MSYYVKEKLREYILRYGKIPKYFNAYNLREVEDIAPTLMVNCGTPGGKSSIIVIEEITDINKH